MLVGWYGVLETKSGTRCRDIDKNQSELFYDFTPFTRVCFQVTHDMVLFPSRPLLDVFDKCYYISVPYEECKRRRRWDDSQYVWLYFITCFYDQWIFFWDLFQPVSYFLFLVLGSTLSPTLPACLMATSGPCTWSTGMRWRTAGWILVCHSCVDLSNVYSSDCFLS